MLKPEKILETKRMTLRPLAQGDELHLMEIISDPEAMRFYERTKGIEDAKDWVTSNVKNFQTKRIGFMACELKEDGKFIGICGPLPQNPIEGRDEIGSGLPFCKGLLGARVCHRGSTCLHGLRISAVSLSKNYLPHRSRQHCLYSSC